MAECSFCSPAPGGFPLIKEDRRPVTKDALQEAKRPMEWVARTVDHRQPEHCARKAGSPMMTRSTRILS